MQCLSQNGNIVNVPGNVEPIALLLFRAARYSRLER
jgi:hypothetical protein